MVFAHPEMKYKEKEVVQFDYLDWPYLPSEEIPYWNHKPLSYDMKIIQGDADPVFKFVQFIKRNPLCDGQPSIARPTFSGCIKNFFPHYYL